MAHYESAGEFLAAQRVGRLGAAGVVSTPSTAEAEIKRTLDNANHAYWKKDDPGHAAAINRMRWLFKVANSEPTPTKQEDV